MTARLLTSTSVIFVISETAVRLVFVKTERYAKIWILFKFLIQVLVKLNSVILSVFVRRVLKVVDVVRR